MKKSLILLLGTLFSFPLIVCCQVFGITAGASLANTHFKAGDISISADNKIGLTAGLVVDIPFTENFSFQPALNYVQKGYKVEISDENYKDKLTLHYVEIPLNILFKPQMQKVRFFVGAGPSIALALSGKEKEEDNGSTNTYKYKFGNNPDEHDMKRLDFGANFITGIETKSGFLVAVNYNLGLSNVAPGDSDDGTIKNRYFGFKVGYLFKDKK
ncbi:MAG: porin family protein [Chitinophagaceae bacterium]